jgi:hypothetical protein
VINNANLLLAYCPKEIEATVAQIELGPGNDTADPAGSFDVGGFEPRSITPETGPLHWGTIKAVEGSRISLELRTGRTLTVDVSEIMPRATSDFAAVGHHLAVGGLVNSDGVRAATGIWRIKNLALFGPDRDN